ncbi:MAG TPA: hypothetical protein DIW46_07355 [Microbacterium sp.]|nr:hypothetical protein [Microbacterium sp.]
MTTPFVDVVIACHDLTRPIERAVGSVLASDRSRDLTRVTVVAHGQPGAELTDRLKDLAGSWRVIEHADGIRSPAGPFNRGLAQATAEYCAVMGSDDYLEPGAIEAWIDRARESKADMIVAPMKIAGQPVMLNPLPRVRRTTKLDAARDRMLYRTAPLGLMRTETVRRLELQLSEGMPTGEDIEFGVRLFTEAERVDFPFQAPCYVIGTDAQQRTSHTALDVAATLAPLAHLLDGSVPTRLSASHRRALAIKFIRVSVLGAVRARPVAKHWTANDVATLKAMLNRLVELSPGALAPLSRQERELTDAILSATTATDIVDGLARSNAMTTRAQRLLPRSWGSWLDRESVLRRYLVHAFRERSLG